MNKKKLYVFIFAFVALLCISSFAWSWWVTRDIGKGSSSDSLSNQKVSVKNLILTETKERKKYWELFADKAEYDSLTSDVILYEIVGNFYDKDESVVLSFRSPKGIYREDEKKIILLGETLLVARDNSSVMANKFEWTGNDNDIIAEGNVIINRNNDIITSSDKAIFNSKLTKFKIIGKSISKIYDKSMQSNKKTRIFK